LKVSLEDKASKQIKVTVVTNGTPQAGYSVGECLASPNMLEVTGGKGVIDKIDSVRVTVNVSGIGEDLKKRVTPVAYDADGKVIESSTLNYGVRKVRVNVQVLKTKTIPVNIKITGKPASGYEFVDAECQPETIQVAGGKSARSMCRWILPECRVPQVLWNKISAFRITCRMVCLCWPIMHRCLCGSALKS
jgi:YbbR domain-containing protein